MEKDKKGDEKEKVGLTEEPWDEKQWKKHWADRNQGHKKRIELLHKESRQ